MTMQELQLIIPLCVGSEMMCLFHDQQEISRNQGDAKRLQVKHLTLLERDEMEIPSWDGLVGTEKGQNCWKEQIDRSQF